MTINQKIAALRKTMKQHGIDAYLIPSSDPHQSEYVADHWKAREWVTGFSGSAGIAMVTQDHAGLWTDSRYFLQAETQLANSEFELHRQKVPHAPEHVSWLAENMPPGSVVGCDGYLFSIGQIRSLRKMFRKKDIRIDHHHDLIGSIWEDRPALPAAPIFAHSVDYAGKSRAEKLQEVVAGMQEAGATNYFVSTLDDIAWVLNIRGADVECNPVAVCYLIIGTEQSYLFIDESKVPKDLTSELGQAGVVIKPYEAVSSFLEIIPQKGKLLLDGRSTSVRLFEAVPSEHLSEGANLICPLKAIKNQTEVKHIKKAMQKDGVALTRLYRWLESELAIRTVSEVEVAEKLADFRQAQGDYFGESFSAIVGYQANGAIIHYRPQPGECADISAEGILLLDSGGQYIDGTTDITRTTALGKPTSEQRKAYTLVLKGHIALDSIQFPQGTSGGQLDILARMHLWNSALNYGHGTGHGVGFFLNVHEPPQGFAPSVVTSRGSTTFKPGMFTSNEPGFYKDGEFGIRIENLILCVESEKNDFGQFLKFEALTLFPIDKQLIEGDLMSEKEIDWLNEYHRKVFDSLSPLLEAEEVKWMEEKCAPLSH